MRIGFDNEKYLSLQSDCIRKRIDQFGGKLYLELGGKLFDDYHASRVLPGFEPDSKIRMFSQLKDELEIIISQGAIVKDVFVEHKVYGKIEAALNICTQRGIRQLVESINSGKSTELMQITDGYHYHTVRAESEQVLDHIEGELRGRGYIVPEK
jgi:uncharacterized protein (UPF0371 family)